MKRYTAAQRLAARTLGTKLPEEAVPSSTAQQHYDRVNRRQSSGEKPTAMSAAEWHARRYLHASPEGDEPVTG